MISVSYLKSIYEFENTIKILDKIDAIDFIHLDIMDGIYVDNNNLDINKVVTNFKTIEKKKDIHLMVSDPLKYIDDLKNISPEYITFHPDAVDNPKEVIKTIKNLGIKVGIAINLDVDINAYENLYNDADLVLVMSVQAGYGGQKFSMDALDKIKYWNSIKDSHSFLVEVDGGINDETYKLLKDLNVDIFVVGAYICTNENFERPINKLLQIK